jgi:hypothetical protein
VALLYVVLGGQQGSGVLMLYTWHTIANSIGELQLQLQLPKPVSSKPVIVSARVLVAELVHQPPHRQTHEASAHTVLVACFKEAHMSTCFTLLCRIL